MDYCNIDYENIDSLEYLRPPVKRNINYSREQTFSTNFEKPTDVKWHLQNRSTNQETKKVHNIRGESSTSLILKKTSEIVIIKKFPNVSHTDINNKRVKAKPLIQVTVIPKIDDSQRNLIKKPKLVKRVHSTVSYQENSIKAKNVYVVVAGRRREKVYEIKSSGSARLSNDQVDHCFKEVRKPVENLTDYKEFIDSLNMDKKRKKIKKKKQNRDFHADDNIQDDGDMSYECQCTEADRGNVRTNLRSDRSRVTIFGRIGVTKDERYVLNCAATVNNEKVPVNGPGFNLLSSDVDNNQESQNCNFSNEYQRDSNEQADFADYNACFKLMDKNTVRNKESQATQVNFNNNLSNFDLNQLQNKERRHDLCDCDHDNRNQIDDLKDCQNPLVIISVYPKKNSETANTIICPSGGNVCNSLLQNTYESTAYSYNINDSNNAKKNVNKNRNANKSLRISRSPSPATRNVSKTKLEGNKQFDVRVPRARKVSPDRRTTNFNKKIERNSPNQKCNARKTTIFNANEPKSKTFNCQGAAIAHNFNTKSQDTKGTNTEHMLTKKLLVENYTKNLALQMNKNDKKFPKTGISNVKININRNNDDYDVFLYQDNCTTDLNVRKTIKKERETHRYNGEHTNDSFQNVLQSTKRESKKWPLWRDLTNDQSKDDWPITSPMSRLNLRDSLEISHRREDKTTKPLKDTQTSENSKVKNINSNDMIFLAPIKHYAGDKCSVPDPLVRDKEIRELLGIEKCRPTTSKTQDTQELHRNTEQVPLQCFCHEECNRGHIDDLIDKVESRTDFKKIRTRTNKHGETPTHIMKSTCTQYEPTAIERTSLYQQMIHSRNIEVFLKVDQFTKQKPIILSRKQYSKVKRTIQNSILNTQEHRRSRSICKSSIISVSEVRKQAKLKLNSLINQTTQTEPKDLDICYLKEEKEPTRCSGITTSKQFEAPLLEVFTADDFNEQHVVSANTEEQNKKNCSRNVSARKAVSLVELCYASVGCFKHVTFGSKNAESLLTHPNIAARDSCSIQTIFKGRRKLPTPNLGTSGFSLFSEMGDSNSVKVLMEPRESKQKKPFLRRLMSCLVMRSTRASEVKMHGLPSPQDQSLESTIDSYHISTSLGAIELSSSIYDTSASFYSNHSISPISNKMKRGFLNSVRGYLLNRKI